MGIDAVLMQAEQEDIQQRAAAWETYWRLLQRAESGDSLDATARAELLAAAKLLSRTSRIQIDAKLIQRALTAKRELERIQAVDLASEKNAIDETGETLRRELEAFAQIHRPKAILLQQRQEKYELDRGQRGIHLGTLERFESLISAGPDSEIANTFSI
ncbi:MAG: hypothetical protein HKL96_09670 [Phycisphaerales bacterium]|nr:hypothetical protein [Phycisphaerales bacterium]